MGIGIINNYRKAATQTVTGSVVLVNVTDLSAIPIGAGQKAKLKWWIPFSLGATGGFRFFILTPGAPTSVTASFKVTDCTTANTFFAAVQTAMADFTNASAVAGNYIGEIILDINNVTAGTISLQYAQNNAQATNNIIQIGAALEVIYL